jgi:hypothetical protein
MKIQTFYNHKTIQKSYKFRVKFENSYKRKDISMNKDLIPFIQDFHVVDVNIPFYEFKKEVQYYGPFPRPMTVLASDGLELEITFEEDEEGTITKFVNWCQRRIINEEGYYTPPGLNYIDNILVEILDDRDDEVIRFNFKKCKFLHASPLKFSYETEESIKIQMIFSCELQEMLFKPGDNVSMK